MQTKIPKPSTDQVVAGSAGFIVGTLFGLKAARGDIDFIKAYKQFRNIDLMTPGAGERIAQALHEMLESENTPHGLRSSIYRTASEKLFGMARQSEQIEAGARRAT